MAVEQNMPKGRLKFSYCDLNYFVNLNPSIASFPSHDVQYELLFFLAWF